MDSKSSAILFIILTFMALSLPPLHACTPCTQPRPPHPPDHHPSDPKIPNPKPHPPPHHDGRGGGGGGDDGRRHHHPPVVIPPPVITPSPPSTTYPPYTGPPPSEGGSGGGGGGSGGSVSGQCPPPPPPVQATCSIDSLKLGLCVDVLGGLVHIGLGNPVENACCPVLGGLLELEAAVCLCTSLRIKLLNINIIIPLALQALITCGKNPPSSLCLSSNLTKHFQGLDH